jgi:copper chaperone CopZ
MKHTYQVTGMTCSGCTATVQKALQKVEGVTGVSINLEKSQAEIEMYHHVPTGALQAGLSGFSYKLSESDVAMPASSTAMSGTESTAISWNDANVWGHASFNTLNCLIGCSIGDFAMIIFLQKYYPGTPMTVMMILAIIAGLMTSVLFETILLRTREKFAWRAALQTAFSMSFMSMVAMEIVMNSTDFMLTGGKAAFGNPMYWTALLISMIAGFLVPLPYNYYKLKKYNQACH